MKLSEFLRNLEFLRDNSMEGDPPIRFEVDDSEVELVYGELKSKSSGFSLEHDVLQEMPEHKETVTIRFRSTP